LKRHGLVRAVKLEGLPAGKEYRIKTMRPNQQWQSDASYFFVVGWGWYYLISVLDDYSRMVLAWELTTDMTSASISEVVEQAVEFTGMKMTGPSFCTKASERVYITKRFVQFADRREP
jgi:putative transposase